MKTDQEYFWAGEFGDSYISRNDSDQLLAANLNLFSKILERTGPIDSALELGCNVGMNLRALALLSPEAEIRGIDINQTAVDQLRERHGEFHLKCGSILETFEFEESTITFTKGVLIHINPEYLPVVYKNLYEKSEKYICLIEYYNPSPVSVTYRGHQDRLFKRDFCKDLIDEYPDLKLIDYGFCYRNDAIFPQDDLTWFLLEK